MTDGLKFINSIESMILSRRGNTRNIGLDILEELQAENARLKKELEDYKAENSRLKAAASQKPNTSSIPEQKKPQEPEDDTAVRFSLLELK